MVSRPVGGVAAGSRINCHVSQLREQVQGQMF